MDMTGEPFPESINPLPLAGLQWLGHGNENRPVPFRGLVQIIDISPWVVLPVWAESYDARGRLPYFRDEDVPQGIANVFNIFPRIDRLTSFCSCDSELPELVVLGRRPNFRPRILFQT